MVWSKTFKSLKAKFGLIDKADYILTDKTQFESYDPENKQQLVIGLDFGTAFTKVVIGEQRVRYAVPFLPYSNKKNPYLLPSILSIIDEDKSCLPGAHIGTLDVIDDIKMRLINRDFSTETKIHAATFIALVLRYSRGWLFDNHAKTYKGRNIVWYVNVGLPTDSCNDQELVDTYRDIVQAAWAISVLPGPISLRRSRSYVDNTDLEDVTLPDMYRQRLISKELINLYPEFSVQLVGYVRSPRRQEGLHMLIDVGSGTFDITTFNIYKNKYDEDLYPIFAQEVKPLGAAFLLKHRQNQLHLDSADILGKTFSNIAGDEEFAKQLNIPLQNLQSIDKLFRSKVISLINEIMKYTKEKRYRMDTQWNDGVLTFLCGGGASMGFYKEVFNKFMNHEPPYKIRSLHLDIPEDLYAPDMPENTYDRLSVAYGLSYDPLDIGEIRKKSEVPDDCELDDSVVGNGVLNHKICPLCNGTGEPMGRCRKCNGSGWIN